MPHYSGHCSLGTPGSPQPHSCGCPSHPSMTSATVWGPGGPHLAHRRPRRQRCRRLRPAPLELLPNRGAPGAPPALGAPPEQEGAGGTRWPRPRGMGVTGGSVNTPVPGLPAQLKTLHSDLAFRATDGKRAAGNRRAGGKNLSGFKPAPNLMQPHNAGGEGDPTHQAEGWGELQPRAPVTPTPPGCARAGGTDEAPSASRSARGV